MRLRAYIRLQQCTTKDRLAFVSRSQESHGFVAGEIAYWAMEGSSWANLRKVLKTFNVIGGSGVSRITAQGYTVDIGDGIGRLFKLGPLEVPPAVLFERARYLVHSPELTSFGRGAVEILDPNVEVSHETR